MGRQGSTTLKGPDYRPEPEPDVWENAWRQLFSIRTPSQHLGLLWKGGGKQMANGEGRKKGGMRVTGSLLGIGLSLGALGPG